MSIIKNRYITLFSSTLFISLAMLGGGYLAVPLLKKRFVDELQLIEADEMADLLAIAQSSPGAIAVNSSVCVGYKVAGFWGVVCSVLGTITPPLVFITLLQGVYAAVSDMPLVFAFFKGMNAAVAAIMIDVVLSYGADSCKKLKFKAPIIIIATFSACYFGGVNPALLIIATIIFYCIYTLIRSRKGVVK